MTVESHILGRRQWALDSKKLEKLRAGQLQAKGFLQVASSPLTRSSYHAGDDFAQMRAAREAKLAKQSA